MVLHVDNYAIQRDEILAIGTNVIYESSIRRIHTVGCFIASLESNCASTYYWLLEPQIHPHFHTSPQTIPLHKQMHSNKYKVHQKWKSITIDAAPLFSHLLNVQTFWYRMYNSFLRISMQLIPWLHMFSHAGTSSFWEKEYFCSSFSWVRIIVIHTIHLSNLGCEVSALIDWCNCPGKRTSLEA